MILFLDICFELAIVVILWWFMRPIGGLIEAKRQYWLARAKRLMR